MDKVITSAAEAVAQIPDGSSLAVGGFGLCGKLVLEPIFEADFHQCS